MPPADVFNLDLINEHFTNPRNVGEIEDASAIGRAGSPVCGAALRITLKIDETQRITDVRFKAIGCSLSISFASVLTEKLKGLTTAETAALAQSSEDEFLRYFGKPPQGKDHCTSLVCDALLVAIRQYSDSVRQDWTGDEALICTCFCVSDRVIEDNIKAGSLRTISEVMRACNAGAGCGSCHSLIADILFNSE